MRKPTIRGLIVGLLATIVPVLAMSQQDHRVNGEYPSASGHKSLSGYDVYARQLKQLDMHADLARAAPAGRHGGFRILLSEAEFMQIGQQQNSLLEAPPMESEKRYQVGVTRAVCREVAFSALKQSTGRRGPSAIAMGVLERVGGSLVWESEFGSFDASAVRVHVSRMNLADGVALYIYNDSGQAYGPFTGRGPNRSGELWSATMAGAEATIQLQSDSDAA
ncbi:MAG: hypothetical protein KJO85_04460, partial [Gammaproteobacteria bacterium]|nr:hypothetical protein [Gammaproteobacteria bacterium]